MAAGHVASAEAFQAAAGEGVQEVASKGGKERDEEEARPESGWNWEELAALAAKTEERSGKEGGGAGEGEGEGEGDTVVLGVGPHSIIMLPPSPSPLTPAPA